MDEQRKKQQKDKKNRSWTTDETNKGNTTQKTPRQQKKIGELHIDRGNKPPMNIEWDTWYLVAGTTKTLLPPTPARRQRRDLPGPLPAAGASPARSQTFAAHPGPRTYCFLLLRRRLEHLFSVKQESTHVWRSGEASKHMSDVFRLEAYHNLRRCTSQDLTTCVHNRQGCGACTAARVVCYYTGVLLASIDMVLFFLKTATACLL